MAHLSTARGAELVGARFDDLNGSKGVGIISALAEDAVCRMSQPDCCR